MNSEDFACVQALRDMAGNPQESGIAVDTAVSPEQNNEGIDGERNPESDIVSHCNKARIQQQKRIVPKAKQSTKPMNKQLDVQVCFPDFEELLESSPSNRLYYIKTRHNNIRCFPRCLPSHRERSFCGTAVNLRLQTSSEEVRKRCKLMKVFGAFQTSQESLETSSSDVEPDVKNLMEGRITGEMNGIIEAVVAPKRKWGYRANNDMEQDHVFTIFLMEKGHIVFQKSTPPFRLIPSWKVETKTPKLTPTSTSSAASFSLNNCSHSHGRSVPARVSAESVLNIAELSTLSALRTLQEHQRGSQSLCQVLGLGLGLPNKKCGTSVAGTSPGLNLNQSLLKKYSYPAELLNMMNLNANLPLSPPQLNLNPLMPSNKLQYLNSLSSLNSLSQQLTALNSLNSLQNSLNLNLSKKRKWNQ